MKFSIICALISVTLAAPSLLYKRGNQIGAGDEGGHVSDESKSTSVNSGGDSIFSGDGNKFSALSTITNGPVSGLLTRRGIIQGLGLLGGNGNGNEDSSVTNTVFAHGNQQLSGQNISNNPVLTTGGLNDNHSIVA